MSKDLKEKYFICTNKDALEMNIICHKCTDICPYCKQVSKKEYDDFWEAYDYE